MNENIEGKIAAILDKSTVVINRGSDQGVEKGTEFYIYSKLGPFFDPDSGESLGETTKIWEKVQATIVERRFCIAETKYLTGYFFPMFTLEKMFRTRVELPVDESDITRLMERIKVGFPVMVVIKVKEIEDKEVLALPNSSDNQDLDVDKEEPEQVQKEDHDEEAG